MSGSLIQCLVSHLYHYNPPHIYRVSNCVALYKRSQQRYKVSSLAVGLNYARTTAHQTLFGQENQALVMIVGVVLTQTAYSPSIAICIAIHRKTLENSNPPS